MPTATRPYLGFDPARAMAAPAPEAADRRAADRREEGVTFCFDLLPFFVPLGCDPSCNRGCAPSCLPALPIAGPAPAPPPNVSCPCLAAFDSPGSCGRIGPACDERACDILRISCCFLALVRSRLANRASSFASKSTRPPSMTVRPGPRPGTAIDPKRWLAPMVLPLLLLLLLATLFIPTPVVLSRLPA